jgi:HSP20 family protein
MSVVMPPRAHTRRDLLPCSEADRRPTLTTEEVNVMKLAVYDEIGELERRMDDLMRSFFGPKIRLTRPVLPLFVSKPFVPVTDVFVRNEDLVIRVELPGIVPEDIEVRIEDGYLVIRGERKREEEIKEEAYYRLEAAYGTFERFIPLPEEFEEREIEAIHTDGVLEVIVPAAAKALEPHEPKTIPVKTTKPAKEQAKKVA